MVGSQKPCIIMYLIQSFILCIKHLCPNIMLHCFKGYNHSVLVCSTQTSSVPINMLQVHVVANILSGGHRLFHFIKTNSRMSSHRVQYESRVLRNSDEINAIIVGYENQDSDLAANGCHILHKARLSFNEVHYY